MMIREERRNEKDQGTKEPRLSREQEGVRR